jgi:exopolysaccharide biosynthesis polyprenyl glycosylphosphotransferase
MEMSSEQAATAPVLARPALSGAATLPAAEDRRSVSRRLVGGRSRAAAIQRALLVADTVALAASVVLALTLVGDPAPPAGGQLAWGLFYIPVAIVLFKLYRLYDRGGKRLNDSTFDDVPAVFHAALVTTLALWGWLKLTPAAPLVFAEAALLLGSTIMLVLAARAAVRWAVPRIVAPERVLLVGAGPSARVLARKLLAHSRQTTVRPVGYLCDEAAPSTAPARDVTRLGSFAQLGDVCRSFGVDRVVIASPDIAHDLLPNLVRDANKAEVKVSLMPSAVDALGPSTELDDLEGLMLLAVNPARFSWSSRLLKRSLDLAVSAAVLPVFLLLLPLVAGAIKLDSPGPVFFRQERLGRGGRRFKILKLRTMVADAEARVGELQVQSAHPAWLVLDQDPRVTRVGRFLRLTSIDELPQFWNVLRGEMSLVGPRPMPVATDPYINGWGRRRLDLTPGITGLWQVMGRASVSFEEMLKLDYLYVTNWTVWGDVRLLMRTVAVVLTRQGAN